jgi:RNA polymerase sigma-70 factor (family 1)
MAYFAPMHPVSDLDLISAIKAGSERHFKQLFEMYWSKLYSLANNVLQNEADSEDIVQELFTDLWNRRATLTIDNLGGYLFIATRYSIAKKLAKRPLQKKHIELFEAIRDKSDLGESLETNDLIDFVRGRISHLPERCKEVFELSRFEQLSTNEIAERLHISASTVENQINKALKNLREDNSLQNELTQFIFILLLTQY